MFWVVISFIWSKVSGFGVFRRENERQSVGDGKKGESYGGGYSTVKSAQRLSATLSIRPRGRVQIIDM